MNHSKIALFVGVPVLFLSACATQPLGPTVQVMPGATKPFEIFQDDQVACKKYADEQVAGQADAQNKKAIGTAAIGTALGGLLGAAVGGNQGAGVGGATGAIAGTGVAANGVNSGQMSIQDQYNNAYLQCMYSKGNQVPGAAPQSAAVPTGMPPPPPDAQAMSSPPPDSGYTLTQAQNALKAHGYYHGLADGVIGPRTRDALRKYQKDHNLPQTGELDPPTVNALQQQ